MEEQFVLRVPPSVAERIERLLNENASSSEDASLDLSFSGKRTFRLLDILVDRSIASCLIGLCFFFFPFVLEEIWKCESLYSFPQGSCYR